MRYILVDRITQLNIGKNSEGLKAITLTDPIFADHFPDFPVFPGALILEGLAQVAGYLVDMTINQGKEFSDPTRKRCMLLQVEKMKFHKYSRAGEQLIFRAELENLLEAGARLTVTAHCGEELRVSGKIQMAIVEIHSKRLSEHFAQIFHLWTVTENTPVP